LWSNAAFVHFALSNPLLENIIYEASGFSILQSVLARPYCVAFEAEHVRHITLRGDRNNNKMEMMNGEIRELEKKMRGPKIVDTDILKGYQPSQLHPTARST
jgi:hypothetical protein